MGKTGGSAVDRTWHFRAAFSILYLILGLAFIVAPAFANAYLQSMFTKVLIFALFAMSLNLLWGYTGLFSLGHAGFFGVAGYTSGLLMTRLGIESLWFILPAGTLMAGLTAAVIGTIVLRVTGIYFLLITFAMGQLLYSVALKWAPVTGGANGLPAIPYPNIGISEFGLNTLSFYYLVAVLFGICLLGMYGLVKSPFGYALQGIKGDENRMQYLGYNTWRHKYVIFVIAGLFAGIAGTLFASYSGLMAPEHLGVKTSTLALLMVIIGGDRIFLGPALGAAVVVLIEHYSSLYVPERWPLILGGAFVAAVMFLRGGISPYLTNVWQRIAVRPWKR